MRSTRNLYIAFALVLAACQTPSNNIERAARARHLQHLEIQGREFRHTIYANAASQGSSRSDEPLWVFIEGDGSPVEIAMRGNEASTRPSPDPTARNPVALKLVTQTGLPAIYLTRPCYGEHHKDPGCTDRYWTSERYSQPVVASLAAAIAHFAGERLITLVGYSGGGVLAILVANELPTVHSVVTIAANLDIDAWTQSSSCRPVSMQTDTASSAGCAAFVDTTNPADIVRSHRWQEFALVGAGDTIVPHHTTARYFERHPDVVVWQYDAFDHVCCWADAWPEIMRRLEHANPSGQ